MPNQKKPHFVKPYFEKPYFYNRDEAVLPKNDLVLYLDAESLVLSDGDAVGSWNDITSNNNDASQTTTSAKPTYREYSNSIVNKVRGEYGLVFPGTAGNKVDVSGINLTSETEVSFEIITKYNSNNDFISIGNAGNNATNGFSLRQLAAGNIYLYHNGKSALVNFSGYSNRWVRIVGTIKQADKMKLYINGAKVDEDLTLTSASLQNANIEIGTDNGSNPFKGTIAFARIWNKELTEAEVLGLESGTIPQSANILGQWEFDDGSGSTLTDSSGNSNDGTITGATWGIQSILPKSIYFDGVDDFLEILGDPASLQLTNNMEIVIVGELQYGASNTSMISKTVDSDPDNTPYDLYIDSAGKIGYAYEHTGGTNDGIISAGTEINENISYIMNSTIDSSNNMEIFVNGVSVISGTGSANPESSSENVTIGKDTGAGHSPLKGYISHILVYARTLTNAERTYINRLFSTSTGIVVPILGLYFNFQENFLNYFFFV